MANSGKWRPDWPAAVRGSPANSTTTTGRGRTDGGHEAEAGRSDAFQRHRLDAALSWNGSGRAPDPRCCVRSTPCLGEVEVVHGIEGQITLVTAGGLHGGTGRASPASNDLAADQARTPSGASTSRAALPRTRRSTSQQARRVRRPMETTTARQELMIRTTGQAMIDHAAGTAIPSRARSGDVAQAAPVSPQSTCRISRARGHVARRAFTSSDFRMRSGQAARPGRPPVGGRQASLGRGSRTVPGPGHSRNEALHEPGHGGSARRCPNRSRSGSRRVRRLAVRGGGRCANHQHVVIGRDVRPRGTPPAVVRSRPAERIF